MTEGLAKVANVIEVSIHTPTKGVTRWIIPAGTFYLCFNPHTHEGCDFEEQQNIIYDLVSIHTPTKGVTEGFQTQDQFICVSIHTPTKGVTSGREPGGCCNISFNPHTHEGCDSDMSTETQKQRVSIHTPTKGVTAYSANG